MPFPTKLQYVLGHQDTLNRPLSLLEKLNAKMDLKAKHIALNHQTYRTHQIFEKPEGYGTISIDGILVILRLAVTEYVICSRQMRSFYNKLAIINIQN